MHGFSADPRRELSPRRLIACLLFASLLGAALRAAAQLPLNPTQSQPAQPNVLTSPAATVGTQFLYQLEARFSADVAKGGGKAFAGWFAPDGVTLANGKAAVMGQAAIAARATWTPQQYQLTWTTEGARLDSGGDSGFTWGTYTGIAHDPEGHTSRTTGRYLTVWSRQPDGQWKVELDASNDAPPEVPDCCRVPGS